nr:DUF3078 domain-containing protein [candidate division Zixibacteria bacterium]
MKGNILGVTLMIGMILLLTIPGQAEPWEKSFNLALNATQASYSDSWTGGEEGNVTWAATADGIFSKKFTRVFSLKNTVKLAFGQTVTQDKDTKEWSRPAKSTDKIDFEALGMYNLETYVEPYTAFRFESQFLDASVDNNKRYINPILLTESAGIARSLYKKDKDDILTRLGFAFRQNINRDFLTIVGTDTTKDNVTSTDGGFESVTDVKLVLNNQLGYIGKLTLYKALFFSKKDDFKGTEAEDYWKAIDINWENTLTADISKYIKVTFYTQLLYDKQISKKGRLKETLALGLTYSLM